MKNINKLHDFIIDEISEITSFDKNKITLLISKRSNPVVPLIDYHEFTYNKNQYILNKGFLSMNIKKK